MRKYFTAVLLIGLFPLGSCGTSIPDMQDIGQSRGDGVLSEIELVQLIRCELHVGVTKAIEQYGTKSKAKFPNPVDWLATWQAKVSLKVTVDDKSSFSPGVSYTEPMKNAVSHYNVTYGQNFSLSAGLQASSQTTRVETVAYTVPFKDFSDVTLPPGGDCRNQIENKVVLSDLKIDDFILAKAQMAAQPDVVSNKPGSPYSAFNDQLSFIVTYSGNITPVWNLMRITANADSPLYYATRTRTHDLTITLGAPDDSEAVAVHNAELIGQAVASALRNR
ncbi:hypothetical protein [Rhizobium leguminosarum]|uniref:hypothetical protein n=1 Tax=Rhizobium leguminosarum TaxID=384 RepID=UPI003F94FF4D